MKTTLQRITTATFIALLLLAGNIQSVGTETKVSGQEFDETSLHLENWMTDETVWNLNLVNMADFIQETEGEMELESWMLSDDYWNIGETVYEKELTLESWMTDSEIWN